MIHGVHSENMVYVDSTPLDLEGSLKIRNHSPTGFQWGYLGSGPAQLSLALLLHFGASEQEATNYYQDFKQEILAQLPQEDFDLADNVVTDWLEARRIFAREFGE